MNARVSMAEHGSSTVLVQGALRGDKSAFAEAFAKHRPLLTKLCWRMLHNQALVEDALQETALQAWLHLNRLRRPESFGSWLAGIALNVCRMWLRDRLHEAWSWEALVGGLHHPEPADEGPSLAEYVEQADLARQVRRAVDDLPTGQRSAVLLFYLAGLSYAETAATLGIEVSAVGTRLHKAREALRRRLWRFWQEDLMAAATPDRLVEVHIEGVEENKSTGQHVVLLREVSGGRRFLPIWIDNVIALQIVAHLENISTPRPQTFAFMASVLRAVSVRLTEARIERLVDDVFYAVAVLNGLGGAATVDARPSDLLALASLMGTPIRVRESILTSAGISAAEPGGVTPLSPMAVLAQRVGDGMAMDAYTPRARRVIALAQEEARRFNVDSVATEHVLLGLIREGGGVAVKVLGNLGLDLDAVRSAVESSIVPGTSTGPDQIGLNSRVKKVMELAADEARQLGHHYIGTEHLLLGLVREGDVVGDGVLSKRGVKLRRVRAKVEDTFRSISARRR
jgi:RNA polymerase sigma factor (sigma-70 family)